MVDDVLAEVFASDPSLSAISAETVKAALVGFPLEPQRSFEWLARGIQVALYVSAPTAEQASTRSSNADIRKELAVLAEQSSATWRAFHGISPAAESALMDYAHRMAADLPEGGEGLPSAFVQFRKTILEMELASQLLAGAASVIGEHKQPPRWRQKESREERVRRAHCLSSIYEDGFGATPFVNTWPDAHLGHWPDFYQRIVALAFREETTPDLVEVLSEARRLHREQRVLFNPGTMLE